MVSPVWMKRIGPSRLIDVAAAYGRDHCREIDDRHVVGDVRCRHAELGRGGRAQDGGLVEHHRRDDLDGESARNEGDDR